jgi:hypothetical protein
VEVGDVGEIMGGLRGVWRMYLESIKNPKDGPHVTTLNMIFSVVTTLSCSTLNFNSLIISVRHKCATTFPTTMSLLLSLLIFLYPY